MRCFLVLLAIFLYHGYACDTSNDPLPMGGANCSQNVECNSVNGGGECSLGNCICAKEWGNPDCSYPRKERDLAGGLQIGLVFVGVGGVGNFIIERTGYAVGQLVTYSLAYYSLVVIACCMCCCAICCDGAGCSDACEGFMMVLVIVAAVLVYLAGFASFIWNIVDGAFILECKIPDGNGYALYSPGPSQSITSRFASRSGEVIGESTRFLWSSYVGFGALLAIYILGGVIVAVKTYMWKQKRNRFRKSFAQMQDQDTISV